MNLRNPYGNPERTIGVCSETLRFGIHVLARYRNGLWLACARIPAKALKFARLGVSGPGS